MAEQRCTICGQTRDGHEGRRHAFSSQPGGGDMHVAPAAQPSQGVAQPRQAPFDPVLRAVLISKGVITAEDLTAAETMLQATGALRVGGR